MSKLALLLLLLPIDVVRPTPPSEPWATVTTVMLFAGNRAEIAYSASWQGVESGPVKMPSQLSNWTCRRGGANRGDQVTSYVECKSGEATVVIDVTCKKREADADLGSVILLNKAHNYGGRFVVTCQTGAALDHEEPE